MLSVWCALQNGIIVKTISHGALKSIPYKHFLDKMCSWAPSSHFHPGNCNVEWIFLIYVALIVVLELVEMWARTSQVHIMPWTWLLALSNLLYYSLRAQSYASLIGVSRVYLQVSVDWIAALALPLEIQYRDNLLDSHVVRITKRMCVECLEDYTVLQLSAMWR